MNNENNAKKPRRMWGLDLEAWNNIIVGFLAVGAISAVIVGVATYISFQLQKQETASAQDALDRYKLETAGKVADATTAGIEAGKTAGNAQAAADDAHIKLKQAEATIAEAEARAAEAKLEAEKLRTQLAWRELTPAQVHALSESLDGLKIPVVLWHFGGDPECINLYDQLHPIFVKAGMIIDDRTLMGTTQLPGGITVSGPLETVILVAARLRAVGLDVTEHPDVGSFQINIGVKPRPRPT